MERLRRVNITEGVMRRHDLLDARWANVETLDEHGGDRSYLHLAEAGKLAQPALQVTAISRLRPHAGRIAVVALGDECAELLDADSHGSGEAVDGRLLLEELRQQGGIG